MKEDENKESSISRKLSAMSNLVETTHEIANKINDVLSISGSGYGELLESSILKFLCLLAKKLTFMTGGPNECRLYILQQVGFFPEHKCIIVLSFQSYIVVELTFRCG
jgi:hypothetical protein